MSYVFTFFIIRSQRFHRKFTADSDLNGPQKFHPSEVPRIGGFAIFFSLLVTIGIKYLQDPLSELNLVTLFACSTVAFCSGFIEDITKKIGVKTRFVASLISGLFVCYFLDIYVSNIYIGWIDYFLNIKIIAIIFSSIMIAGLINSYNIIDGFNGLASMTAMITLLAIAYVSYQVNDSILCNYALIMNASIAGFFIWNYPRGHIFLGDGGAYLIGFWIAALSILLVARNPQVSPWFACLINIYPVFETIFSIWRKKFIRKISPGQPDGAHLHMLIYGRIARWMRIDDPRKSFLANARTAPFLWILSGTTIIPSILFWRNTLALQLLTILFCIFYLLAYRSLVLFKTRKWFS